MSHEQAVELLPWLLNGSMDEDEQEKVREHALSCVVCRRELQALELINRFISDAAKSEPIPAPDMRRINARIDRWIEHRSGLRQWFSRWSDTVTNPWRLAFAAQTVLVIALAAMILWPASEEAEFTTLTQPRSLPDGRYLRVVLSPDTAVSELAGLLDDMELRVADGPTPRGVYTLAVPQPLTGDDRLRLLQRLQENPRVLFAQWVNEHDRP